MLLIDEHKPNIIALSVTWLAAHQTFNLPGFKIARKDRNGHGGGVLLAIEQSINVEYSTVTTSLEVVSCIIHLTDGSFVSVASIYLPPVPFHVSYADLNNCINQIKEPRMLLGDFNPHSVD